MDNRRGPRTNKDVPDPQVFALPPIRKEARQVAPLFGGMKGLVAARNELIRRLYQQTAG